MDDDDDVPPLEDMSELINKSLNLKSKKVNGKLVTNEFLEPISNTETQKVEQMEKLLGKKNDVKPNQPEKTSERKKESGTFCGFKKGFLVQSQTKPVKKASHPDNKAKITEVKKTLEKEKNVIPEVQSAMKAQIPLLESKEWITEDLLSKVMSDPKLSRQFNDPQFSKAIEMFQTEPEKVMAMCQHNAELREFIQKFCALMGDHFTNLADSKKVKTNEKPVQNKASDEDQEKMKNILSDPEVVTILQAPEIQKLFVLIRSDSEQVSRVLNTANAELRYKIQRLIDVGLLNFSGS